MRHCGEGAWFSYHAVCSPSTARKQSVESLGEYPSATCRLITKPATPPDRQGYGGAGPGEIHRPTVVPTVLPPTHSAAYGAWHRFARRSDPQNHAAIPVGEHRANGPNRAPPRRVLPSGGPPGATLLFSPQFRKSHNRPGDDNRGGSKPASDCGRRVRCTSIPKRVDQQTADQLHRPPRTNRGVGQLSEITRRLTLTGPGGIGKRAWRSRSPRLSRDAKSMM